MVSEVEDGVEEEGSSLFVRRFIGPHYLPSLAQVMPYKDKNKRNEYMRNYMLKRYEQRRKQAIIYLGGKCVDCNSKENLEFDHKDRDSKEFSIAQGSSMSETRFWLEVEKCVLRCNMCHIERSKQQRKTSPVP